MRRIAVAVAVSLAAALAASGAARAQQWPTAPVRVIVNIAPGGVADRTIRMLAPRLGEHLGRPLVIENRPGGEGYIGFETAARAEPDGHTMLFSPGSTMMITPHLVKRPDFDPTRQLLPVAPFVRISMFLVVKPSLPAKNVGELVSLARSSPGRLAYGTAGTGSALHIAAAVFSREAKVELNHIPYKGAGPAMADLLGGQLDLVFDPGIGLEHAKAGRTRMLAVTSEQRHPDFPDVPTMIESGYKGIDGGPYFGLFAPLNTPREAIGRMNREVLRVLAEPELRRQLLATGLEVSPPMTPEAYGAYIRAESQAYARLLPEIGVKGQ